MTDQNGPNTDNPKDGEPQEDDQRRKFREALEKKQRKHHAVAEGVERDGSEKSHGATEPTATPMFRRKSI